MKKLFLLVSILFFSFILSACDGVRYRQSNDYHCYARRQPSENVSPVVYNYRVNLYSISGEYITTGISSTTVYHGEKVSEKLPKWISLADFRYSGFSFQVKENELLNQGQLVIGWEDIHGNLVDTTKRFEIDFFSCNKEPINFYLRTEEVTRFYRLITGTGVTAELAEMAYNNDSEGLIRLLEPILSGENGNPLENDILSWEQRSLREVLFTLLKVNLYPLENTWRVTVEKDELKQVLDIYKEVYEYFDASYFNFLSRFLELDFNWTDIYVYQDRIEFGYAYTISSVQNQRGYFKITLLLDALGELSNSPIVDDESYRLQIDHRSGDRCSPSLSNCQFYSRGSQDRTITWVSNDNEISNPRHQLSLGISLRASAEKFFDELIEIWVESNKLLVE
jgi:hypothetical protein